MMKQTKDVTAMLVDFGPFMEMGRVLGRTMKKVYLYTPWECTYPKIQPTLIGKGYPEIEPIMSIFGPHFKDIDLFVFPDISYGPLQAHLVSLGKAVWGSRMGEDLEMFRHSTKKVMARLGLDVSPYVVLKGIDALRDYLKTHKGTHWVKLNIFRATFETFKAEDYRMVESRIDSIAHDLGPYKNDIEIIVEDDIPDALESGVDGYCIDGALPENILRGFEIKGEGYLGCMTKYSKLPPCITDFDKKMKPVLRAYGYRGSYSTEVRVTKDKAFMIDFCGRNGSPPNEAYQVLFSNMADIVWYGANGKLVEPVPAKKWAAEIMLYSAWAVKDWQPVIFPKEYAPYVKLRSATIKDGVYHVVPQVIGTEEIGAAVGIGDSMDQAIKMATEVAESIKGYDIDPKSGSMEDAKEEFDKARERGIINE
jgi:hypothetical protein